MSATPADQLRAKRVEMGMTQREAAKYIGISQTHLGAIESGKMKVGASAQGKIAAAFGVEFPIAVRAKSNAIPTSGGFHTWGERIAAKRVERKLTQATLAKMIGVTTPCVWYWENDIQRPASRRLIALARALLIDPVEMLKGF